MRKELKKFSFEKTVNVNSVVSLIVLAIIILMVLPVPSWLLDLGLAISFTISIYIFAIALAVTRPVQFDQFPTVLLIALTLRLAMNIASTKLIIGEGHTGLDAAGGIISGFSNFVMSGSVAIGFVTFCVLMIVNFVVITRGAGRMAEVSARFALDGLPGKQLAIDADVGSGAISHEEAVERREMEQRETTFFGSLDGVSKFVKGDAIAGILIILLNIIVGSLVSIFVHGESASTSIETIATLTVGDGLVSQIPAVIISISSGLLLAKASNSGKKIEETEGNFRTEGAFFVTVVVVLVLALMPGLPFWPFFACFGLLIGTAVFLSYDRPAGESLLPVEKIRNETSSTVSSVLENDDIEVRFSSDLAAPLWQNEVELAARISNMRSFIAKTHGLFLPDVRLTEANHLSTSSYEIRILGVGVGGGELLMNSSLVLIGASNGSVPVGRKVLDPVFSAPAVWVPKDRIESLSLDNFTIVTPIEVLCTHLLEEFKRNLSELLTARMLSRILDMLCDAEISTRADENTKLVKSLIPDVITLSKLQRVLKLFLKEGLSINNLPLILESLPEHGCKENAPEAIYEKTRQRLGFQITSQLLAERKSLPVIQLSNELTRSLQERIDFSEGGLENLVISPQQNDVLVDGLKKFIHNSQDYEGLPVLVVARTFRYYFANLLRSNGLNISVAAFDELDPNTDFKVVGSVAI